MEGISLKIYEPIGSKHFECVNMVDDEDYEVLNRFDGSLLASVWKPLRVRRVRADHRQGFKASDFPWLGSHALVFRSTAVESLGDILRTCGELLPLVDEGGVPLFVLNAQVIPALNVSESDIEYFPGSTRIMYVAHPKFHPERICGVDLFRTGYRGAPTYVSNHFVERVKASHLKGLDFTLVWEGL